ncbi:Piwi-domain-containing protein [Coniophora puteana RWD-64-598 SS2]|uniref:Piwi-domain-containing protein n=1 Tax=Coniophora puteana (strain RWD-64-598) TaxID=741705 RepID=A0A5M3N3H9_CONPW|nr:Piwi-domain-containing protein [Coniophora puteana RWD-64-598 SS2]EIW85395.1 Piwi-domain-containing protein [Coniophora puteana RWD-64-598 SS2]
MADATSIRHGTMGRRVMVKSNMFSLKLKKALNIHQYDEIKPDFVAENFSLPPNKPLEIMTRLQNREAGQFNPRGAFDGKKIFWSTVDLPFGPKAEFTIELNEQDPNRPRDNPNRVKVLLVKVAVIDNHMLRNVGAEDAVFNPRAMTALNMMNVLLRIAPASKWPHNARSFYTNHDKMDHQGLELWRGYFQSVRPIIGNNLAVNVDMSAGVMIPARARLIDLAMRYLGLRDARQLSDERNFQRLRSFLRHLAVEVDLPMHRGRFKKVVDIVRGGGAQTFTNKDGVEITVEQHFQQIHNVRTQFRDLPGIRVGRSDIFPIEFCLTGKAQLYRSKLSGEFTTKMLTFTSQRPEARLAQICNGWNDLEYHNSDYVLNAGMEISNTPAQVKARVLDPPGIGYTGDDVNMNRTPGSWNVLGKRFFKPANLEKWAVVSFAGEMANDGAIAAFVNTLGSVLVERAVGNPGPTIFQHPGRVEAALDEVAKRYPNAPGQRKTMILIILRENSPDAYDRIKMWGTSRQGYITSCVRWGKKMNNQYCNNLALKINGKMDGINSIPQDRCMKEFASLPTMVIGGDVSHPGPGDNSRPSIAALVASYDENACRYVADIRPQRSRVEIIQEMEAMTIKMLDNFVQKNGIPPKRIVYYRDGVSEGELPTVGDHEKEAIRAAIKSRYPAYGIPNPNPDELVGLTMIVVAKRHHVRFFPVDPRDLNQADRISQNCIAGSVVDHDVVHPGLKDFYLLSHAGIKGTSRPAHYIVLSHNNVFSKLRGQDGRPVTWNIDMLQGMSFALCHAYFPATRSVSIPAPKVCQLAKTHFANWIDDTSSVMSDKVPSYEDFVSNFHSVHPALRDSMYWL